jgi:hypothetical protein
MMNENDKQMEGRRRRLYDESLVRNIMLATSYCIKDLLDENPDIDDEEIYEFIEVNYHQIIEDTLNEFNSQKDLEGEEAQEELLNENEDEFLPEDESEDEELS